MTGNWNTKLQELDFEIGAQVRRELLTEANKQIQIASAATSYADRKVALKHVSDNTEAAAVYHRPPRDAFEFVFPPKPYVNGSVYLVMASVLREEARNHPDTHWTSKIPLITSSFARDATALASNFEAKAQRITERAGTDEQEGIGSAIAAIALGALILPVMAFRLANGH